MTGLPFPACYFSFFFYFCGRGGHIDPFDIWDHQDPFSSHFHSQGYWSYEMGEKVGMLEVMELIESATKLAHKILDEFSFFAFYVICNK